MLFKHLCQSRNILIVYLHVLHIADWRLDVFLGPIVNSRCFAALSGGNEVTRTYPSCQSNDTELVLIDNLLNDGLSYATRRARNDHSFNHCEINTEISDKPTVV